MRPRAPDAARAWPVSIALCLAGCGDDGVALPEGTCSVAVWARPSRGGTEPRILGEWTEWRDTAAMSQFDDTWWVAELALPPGEYGYLVVEEGEAHVDRHNPQGGWRESDGVPVSWLIVEDCLRPRVAISADAERLELLSARDDEAIVAVEVAVDGEAKPALDVPAGATQLDWTPPVLPRGRHVVELRARGRAGVAGPATSVAVWTDPVADTPADAIVYHMMIDRYRGDDGAALATPSDPGTRAGGTLDGVRAELERGTFDAMGVSTLWLSPVYLNPDEARTARDSDRLVEGYHGYWPLDSRAVDGRIGGDAALDALVASAHDRGIRVVLDLVPNHYDEGNPRVLEHGDDGWFNERDPVCVCGAADCPWSTEIETCWFTPYLPDVRLQQPDALAAAIDDALWWQARFGIDGYRVDAVPMMPRAATRRIYHAVRRAIGPAGASLLLGEVFTGPGAGGIAALRYHLGPDGLDSVFDFPTMWAIRDVLTGRAGFDALVDVLQAEDDALAGSGAVLARMLGNHDTARITSVVAGDDARDPWASPPTATPTADELARVRLGFALVFTLPGMPVVYYGDEVGLPGANDPDSRRVMPDPAALDPAASALAADVATLGTLRRCSETLRRGAWRPVGVTAEHLAFVREGADTAVLVVASAAADATAITVPAAVAPGWYKDAMSGARLEIGEGGVTFDLPPFGVLVLVPEEHACA
jgi:glycosidase